MKELKAAAGFVSSDEMLNLDASYQGQDVKTVKLKTVSYTHLDVYKRQNGRWDDKVITSQTFPNLFTNIFLQ